MTLKVKTKQKISAQVKAHSEKPIEKKKEYDGDITKIISTGSTLLDLAISGGRVHGGGIPGGILVEVFGPSSSGKTVLLSEIAGAVQRQGGQVMFHDPEARLNKQFASMFGFDFTDIDYTTPDTVTEVFLHSRKWEPKTPDKVNGIFADSLAALSTDLEMDKDEGDKMGMRRAKEFSEQLRKTARILVQKNWLMVCSNQVRVNVDAGGYGEKYTTPGGMAIGYYASLRLRALSPEKIYDTIKVAGKEVKRVIGVKTTFEVYKSSVWRPFMKAPVVILFDYGIDDIRMNLQFIKDYTSTTVYMLDKDRVLKTSMSESIAIVEENGWENDLREIVIALWEKIEAKFDSNRKTKQR